MESLLRERVERYLSAVGADHPVAEDTVAFIRALAAHVPVGIASGAFREEIEHVLEAAGLSELVSAIVAIDEVEAGKPIPRATAALAHINRGRPEPIAPEDTVVFEDATDWRPRRPRGGYALCGSPWSWPMTRRAAWPSWSWTG